jgi:hypothetical protein
MLTMCPTYRTRAALPWPRPHCARCVPWRAADAAAPHGCMLLDLAFAWSVSPQSVVCPVLRGGVGWEGRRSVRDACACELEQERARTLHPIKSHRVRFLATPNFQRFKRQPIFSNF